MQAKEIFKIIEADFPLRWAEKWDHCGRQYGKKTIEVDKVLVALDLTTEVINEAIKKKVNLIITHHPFVFQKLKKEQKVAYKNKIFKLLDENNITVYATHTNFDGKMNELILSILKGENIRNFTKDNHILKVATVKTTANLISETLKKLFEINVIQHNLSDFNQKIKTVAICTGAGGSYLNILPSEIDLFITGEVKWNEWVIANEKNLNVICFNHYMENYYTKIFTQYLAEKFPALTVDAYEIKNIINYR
ncbi:Nif3-like dinuclear metal center hexameric protein [Spiroplasma chrysopicola]|uniref:GTP cyclohydrolase 1 type 2 homolog n=1 Tax=Spiroplasma chrysopicola DF-1 TaxID=1276227 RepID=R4U0V1_9MOLU|nr:Nif3-like dinuclear metal center hexameric protein [Spiroplasma chrysopicola]AGM24917.1 hypothetical protein SCHRY_v1c03320 [Spiroplasma chrysopicola DF-1]